MNALFGSVAAAAVVPLATALPAVQEVDPIFALIAKHQAAHKTFTRAVYVKGNLVPGPEFEAAAVVADAASDVADGLLWEILHAQPTSLAGVAALLDHVAQREFPGESDGQTLLTTWDETATNEEKWR